LCNRFIHRVCDIFEVRALPGKRGCLGFGAVVYSTSGIHFVCNGPEASLNIVTPLRAVASVWHLRLQLRQTAPPGVLL
jgi:hypothetical protein